MKPNHFDAKPLFRATTLIALALTLALPGLAGDSSALADLIRDYETLEAGTPVSVSGFRVAIGHAELTTDGTVTPLIADGERVGLLLGAGTFNYVAATTDEHSAVRYNARNRDVRLEEGKGVYSISEPFGTAVVFGNDLPPVEGDPVSSPGPSRAEHEQTFSRQRYRIPVAHLLASPSPAGDPGASLFAEIAGSKHSYLYHYDDVWDHDETLTVLHPPKWRTNADRNMLYETEISRQPIGRTARQTAPPAFMLTHVDVELHASSGNDARLLVKQTIVPNLQGLQTLRMLLNDEWVFDVNEPARHYNLRKVTDGTGRAIPFHHAAGDLIIGLAEPAAAGKPVQLTFEIEGDFLYRPEGSNYWELGIEPWFPWPRQLNAMGYTYHSLITVPKPFVPFGSGKTVTRGVEGETNVLETRIEQPVSYVAILAGRYQFAEETREGQTVRVASFISKNADAYKTLTNLAFAAIDYYPFFLGPFPFDEITIIEKNDLGYGQAPAGLVFITREAFQPKFEDANRYVKGINLRFAHEIAHQYWGHVVRMESREDQWIEESFADYSAALFMKAAGREKDYVNAVAGWKGDAGQATDVATIAMANRLRNPQDRYEQAVLRQALVYAKGSYLLTALHKELGDEVFLTLMKSYQASFRGKHGNTENLIGLLNYLTKKDYGPFFEEYFYGTAMPKL